MVLRENERVFLEERVRARKPGYDAVAIRARIVLACAQGLTNAQVAEMLKANLSTVGKWRKRFLEGRLSALNDLPRPGAPREIDAAVKAAILKATAEGKDAEGERWTTRLLAKKFGVSPQTVSRVWRAAGLHTRRGKTMKLTWES